MTPFVCSLQIDGKQWHLGLYELEEDAARAYDEVARALGGPVNLTEPGAITGPRSKGAEQQVAEAVNAAKAPASGDKERHH